MAAIERLLGLGFVRPFPSVGYAPVRGPFSDEPLTDRFDTSPCGYELDRLTADPPVRTSKIAAVRSAIERGTYETPDKLDRAIESMLQEL